MGLPFIDPEVPLKLFDPNETREQARECERERERIARQYPANVTRPSVMKLVRQNLSYRAADKFLEMIDRNAIPDATNSHINLRVRDGRDGEGGAFTPLSRVNVTGVQMRA